jgi:hypothetical protein
MFGCGCVADSSACGFYFASCAGCNQQFVVAGITLSACNKTRADNVVVHGH